jgi:uncharacterized protein
MKAPFARIPVIRTLASAMALAAACALPSQSNAAGEPQNLPAITLNAGIYNIRAQVARTAEQREIGLMFRQNMPVGEGMLFIFEDDAQQCFWMKNTLIPLAVAFIADDGTVVNTDEMKAQTLDSHCSTRPVKYVLEMNQGWFAKRGIKSGSKLGGAPFAN